MSDYVVCSSTWWGEMVSARLLSFLHRRRISLLNQFNAIHVNKASTIDLYETIMSKRFSVKHILCDLLFSDGTKSIEGDSVILFICAVE